MTLPITDTYGYHIIDTPEKKAKFAPKLATDEMLYTGDSETWLSVMPDGFFSDYYTYRRRIPVGAGFELVGLDSSFCDGAELTFDGVTWRQKTSNWLSDTPRQHLAEFARTSYVLAFRRKSQPKVESGWTRCAPESLPTYPCFVTDGKEVAISNEASQSLRLTPCLGWPLATNKPSDFDAAITHWKPCELPALPEPVKSAEEIAFEKVKSELDQDVAEEAEERGMIPVATDRSDKRWRKLFDAGREFERSGKVEAFNFPIWVSSMFAGSAWRIDSETTGIYFDGTAAYSQACESDIREVLNDLPKGNRTVLTASEIAKFSNARAKK